MGLIGAFENHLWAVLGLQVKAKPWKEAVKLPHFFSWTYDFFLMSVFGNPCVVAVAKEEITPAIIKKHLKIVGEIWKGPCIYVCTAISSYNRKGLIARRIPFVVPGNQIYLPDLGIDLREYFRKQYTSAKPLSPSTQLVIIYALLHFNKNIYIPSELAKKLKCSAMTMTRAFNELEAKGIAVIEKKGRECWLSFKKTRQDLWEEVKSLLRNPVRKRIWVKQNGKSNKKPGVRAGLSALSDLSMLGEPDISVCAVDTKTWKRLSKTKVMEEIPSADEADLELEIWIYNPNLFAKNGLIDPFSLYLSVKEIQDERVESALERVMEKIKW